MAEKNPLRNGLIEDRTGDACAVVIFGASGDLTARTHQCDGRRRHAGGRERLRARAGLGGRCGFGGLVLRCRLVARLGRLDRGVDRRRRHVLDLGRGSGGRVRRPGLRCICLGGVFRDCAPGTVCVAFGTSILCDFPDSQSPE